MSILTHLATAETVALALDCANPACDAGANPDLRIPLCGDCARDVALQYLAVQGDRPTSHDDTNDDTPIRDGRAVAGCVYFVRFSDRIKIGFTADMDRRMKVVPHDEVLAVFPGTYHDEATCHRMFARHRITGEWFAHHPDILDFIAHVESAA